MIYKIDVFYFSIISAGLALSALGVWFTAIVPGLDRWNKRFFLSYFIVFLLCCGAGLGDMMLSYAFGPGPAYYSFMVLECLILSLPLLMLTVYLLHCCGEDIRRNRLLHAVLGLWAVYVVLLIYAAIYYSTSDTQGSHRLLYALMLLPLVVILLVNLVGTVKRRDRLSRKVYHSFLIAILPMTASLTVQMFVDVFPLVDVSYALSALAMFGLVLSDRIEQDLMHQREIANQRASIMVLQMRPHFIYNTLMSIYSLCKLDPPKARQVTMDFTNYLRKNFTAVASADPIPFTSELEHTRAYLAVEQAQYEDSLLVEYDTPHTMFRVPPLTLQPIVENAVKHGRDPYAGAFHISVRTRKTDSGSEIVVEDDGRGFDPAADSEGHLALNNIRQRLEIMCSGTLTIAPRPGGGTVVTIRIPMKKASFARPD